jgi:hypothetical protein
MPQTTNEKKRIIPGGDDDEDDPIHNNVLLIFCLMLLCVEKYGGGRGRITFIEKMSCSQKNFRSQIDYGTKTPSYHPTNMGTCTLLGPGLPNGVKKAGFPHHGP